MTIWYRAHQSKNVSEVFSGDGGLFVAGRWHHVGTRAIYCSESIALCTLEWLSHHGLSVSGLDYYRYSINIPDKLIKKISIAQLPKNWRATPAVDDVRDFSDHHLFSDKKFLAICVPSVVVPEEYNLIINPLHTGFQRAFETIHELGKYAAPKR